MGAQTVFGRIATVNQCIVGANEFCWAASPLARIPPLIFSEQNRRHDVKPGITGWAQVNGRNAISWEEKFKLDIYYVDQQNLLLDLKIIALTCKNVLTSKNIDADNQTTMLNFKGSSYK